MELFSNQINAVDISIKNDFESGIHFHATGTGKSLIALTILDRYHQTYPNRNVVWICEKKSILIEQFCQNTLRNRGFHTLIQSFNLLNFTENKNPQWTHSVNVSKYWGKPYLLIINRSFLTSGEKYKHLKVPIHLVIHDECHTIVNSSSQAFYHWLLIQHPKISCIGFTATPNTNYPPYTKILSQYSIYQAVRDQVILPPKIQWITPLVSLEGGVSQLDIITIVKHFIRHLPYKKLVIWAGMIEYCYQLAHIWEKYLPEFLICVDTSANSYTKDSLPMVENKRLPSYDVFHQASHNAILFCAGKHREGSDIPHLDGCVFLDFVSNRDPKLFTQSLGRVLRRDPDGRKKLGLMIDFNAKSAINITERLSQYLMLPKSCYPWKVKERKLKIDNFYKYKLNTLEFDLTSGQVPSPGYEDIEYSIDDIRRLFVRPIPNDTRYEERLRYELDLIEEKKLARYLIQAIDILKMTQNIPHITRGSCGSSLTCYLLGISQVDPILYNIKFARFLNQFRDTLPDIDFDFPYNTRDSVFLEIEKKWPGKMARISNHVYYHDKSATREALRSLGYRHFISKHNISHFIQSLPTSTKNKLEKKKKELLNTFKCYSLHCGGIVFYPEGVPDNLKIRDHSLLSQISHNKEVISGEKRFKIDILSSRGLAQLQDIYHDLSLSINFDANNGDPKTISMLSRGDNIGITLAESPLMRKAFLQVQPQSIEDVAICLSLIRPAATDAREFNEVEEMKQCLIFDDDAIDILSQTLECDDGTADKLRRLISKSSQPLLKVIEKHQTLTPAQRRKVGERLKHVKRYGFCKSHAYSYAQLVWQLSYAKAHYPQLFWKSTLRHCKSSYKPWVHLYEAKKQGVDKVKGGLSSIYANHRKAGGQGLDHKDQMIKYGYWMMENESFYPDCYIKEEDHERACHIGSLNVSFRGLVASSRVIRMGKKGNKNIVFLGVGRDQYIELSITQSFRYSKNNIGIEGRGKWADKRFKIVDVLEAKAF